MCRHCLALGTVKVTGLFSSISGVLRLTNTISSKLTAPHQPLDSSEVLDGSYAVYLNVLRILDHWMTAWSW
jgi:hypothetical protein